MIQFNFTNQKRVIDITKEVEVSPSPYDTEAYAKWLAKKQKERDKKLPMKLDKDDIVGYDNKGKVKRRGDGKGKKVNKKA